MAEYPGAAWAGVSPNRSDRQGRVKLFIVHHYAGTQDPASARNRFMSPNDRSVSPNYQVNADGKVYEIVPPDRFRAWTTGTIDHQAVTCETQNTSGAPSWGISAESHEAIAHLIAWASKRYGFPIQRGRVDEGNVVAIPGVVGHRETPAGRQTSTACPGPSMNLDWLVERAQQIAAGAPAAVVPEPIREEEDMPGIRIHHQVFTNGNQAYVVETETGFFIPGPDHLAALAKAYDVKLDKLPHVSEYDWNAVTAAKSFALAGYPAKGESITDAQIQTIATAAASAAAAAVGSADAEAVARAVEQQLRDDFAAIPDAVLDKGRDRLAE